MADAYKKQYREEVVNLFEAGTESMLRMTTTRENQLSGNTAVFNVAGTDGSEATERGRDGNIVYSSPNNTQVEVTLTETTAGERLNKFIAFAQQSDQVSLMARNVVKKLNRKVDTIIIDQLNTATQETSTAAREGSLNLVMHATAILGNNHVMVEQEDRMFGVITPAFRSYLMQAEEFTSFEYVDVKIFNGSIVKYKRWAGINWIVSSLLPGLGTSSEKCFIFHQDAIGYASNSENYITAIGSNEEHHQSYANAVVYQGAKILQNAGVVMINHDGSRFASV